MGLPRLFLKTAAKVGIRLCDKGPLQIHPDLDAEAISAGHVVSPEQNPDNISHRV
jgi:hypothetical protein